MRRRPHHRALVATAAAALVLLEGATALSRKRPTPCPGGRFLVQSSDGPLVAGASTPLPDAVVVNDHGRVVIASGCPETAGRLTARARFARLSARWAACDAMAGVRLRAKLAAPACDTLVGRLRAKRQPAKRFTATRSGCGDGVVDEGGGEQ